MNGYIALIRYPADSVEWLVSFPDLPDCRASGRSMEDAITRARAALTAHLADVELSGVPAPEARHPGEMLLSANDDPALAGQMIGAVLRVIEPDGDGTPASHATAAGKQFGFYGELRQNA